MKKLLILIAVMAVVALVPAMSFAQDGGGKGKGPGGPGGRQFGPTFVNERMLLSLFDADKDGKIAKKEWDEVFKKIDADGDGALSQEELTKYQEKAREEAVKTWFETLDKNGDGSISKEEFGGREQGFNKLDTNGDGKLTLEEMKAAGERMRGMGEGGKMKEGPKEEEVKDKDTDKE